MNWLVYLNYYFLRWFGIRLARRYPEDTRNRPFNPSKKQIGWTIIRKSPRNR